MASPNEDVFQVVVRFRPLNDREQRQLHDYRDHAADDDDDDDDDELLQIFSEQTFSFDGKAYTFDRVFPCECTQSQLYEETVLPLVERFVAQPHDVTIIAYGQTSSGKTWTIDGDFYGRREQLGILPRSLIDLFRLLRDHAHTEFSFYEIYCERIVDLLATSETLTVQLFDDRKTGKIFMKNLCWARVNSADELLARLTESRSRRHYAATEMNANSSRSHTVFDLRIAVRTAKSPQGYKNFRVVDLAGSERAARTKATGTTFEEGKKINQSLMDLRSIIAQLSRNQPARNVNHRASKLTRILYPSFRGKSRVIVLTCCSPALDSRSETAGSLQFACYAKRITLKLADIQAAAVKPEAATRDEMARKLKAFAEEAEAREQRIEAYQTEVNELRELIQKLRGPTATAARIRHTIAVQTDPRLALEQRRYQDVPEPGWAESRRGQGHQDENREGWDKERERVEGRDAELDEERERAGRDEERKREGRDENQISELQRESVISERKREGRDENQISERQRESRDENQLSERKREGRERNHISELQREQFSERQRESPDDGHERDDQDRSEDDVGVQRYQMLLEKERRKVNKYRNTCQLQRKLLEQKIEDNELLDQELQMLRTLKNIILQEF